MPRGIRSEGANRNRSEGRAVAREKKLKTTPAVYAQINPADNYSVLNAKAPPDCAIKQPCEVRDGPFGKAIVIHSAPPEIAHLSPYLQKGHLSILISGASGSGKSTLLCEIIPNISLLSQIIVCSGCPGNTVYDSIEAYCAQNDIEYHFYSDVTEAIAGIEQCVEHKQPGTYGLIIFDDFNSSNKSNNELCNVMMNDTSRKLRNYGMHNIFISQSSTLFQTIQRANSNMRITFRMNDKYAIDSIADDMVALGIFNNTAAFRELFKYLMKEEHSFLMVPTKASKDHKLWFYSPSAHKFTEISQRFNIMDRNQDDDDQ